MALEIKIIEELKNKAKFELTQIEQEIIKNYIGLQREFARDKIKEASGICGEEGDYYQGPGIILNCKSDAVLEITLIKTVKERQLAFTDRINKAEAEDLIKKLQAFLQALEAISIINSLEYKVDW